MLPSWPIKMILAAFWAMGLSRSFCTSSGPMPAGSPVKSAMVGRVMKGPSFFVICNYGLQYIETRRMHNIR